MIKPCTCPHLHVVYLVAPPTQVYKADELLGWSISNSLTPQVPFTSTRPALFKTPLRIRRSTSCVLREARPRSSRSSPQPQCVLHELVC